jgi:hypothetical protein
MGDTKYGLGGVHGVDINHLKRLSTTSHHDGLVEENLDHIII